MVAPYMCGRLADCRVRRRTVTVWSCAATSSRDFGRLDIQNKHLAALIESMERTTSPPTVAVCYRVLGRIVSTTLLVQLPPPAALGCRRSSPCCWGSCCVGLSIFEISRGAVEIGRDVGRDGHFGGFRKCLAEPKKSALRNPDMVPTELLLGYASQ